MRELALAFCSTVLWDKWDSEARMVKVAGAKMRGSTYHLKPRIPQELRSKHNDKEYLERSLRTSDPATARKMVTLAEADLFRDLEAV